MHGALRTACAAFLVTAVGAQERVTTAGRVLDREGRPVVAATVTFVGSEPPLGERFVAADHVEVVTNDKGRFCAELRQGYDYSCWAAGPPTRSGARYVSRVIDRVRGGMGFEIALLQRRSPGRIVVGGLEAWAGIGPLRVEVGIAAAHVHTQALEIVSGAADLPTRPADAGWLLLVYDRDDQLLWGEVPRDRTNELRFHVPRPREIPVRVADGNGAPIADALIRVEVGSAAGRGAGSTLTPLRPLSRWRIAGRTGADGSARVLVPSRADPLSESGAQVLMLASKAGHAASLGGWTDGPIVDGRRVERLQREEVPFTLEPMTTWNGTLIDVTGRPMAGADLELSAWLAVHESAIGVRNVQTSFRTRSAENGTFRFEQLPATLAAPRLLICRRPTRGDPDQAPPALLTPELDRPFELDLQDLARLALTAIDCDGAPARNADLLLLPLPLEAGSLEHHAVDAASHAIQFDNRGRANVRVQRGRWALVATDRVGISITILDAAGKQQVRLDMKPLAVMHGVVLMDPGASSGDVTFRIDNGVVGRRLVPNRMVTVEVADEEAAVLAAISHRFNRWQAAATTVAGDGRFTLRFLAVAGMTFSGLVSGAGRMAKIELLPGTQPIEFDLRDVK